MLILSSQVRVVDVDSTDDARDPRHVTEEQRFNDLYDLPDALTRIH
jgi:hypothetical protein